MRNARGVCAVRGGQRSELKGRCLAGRSVVRAIWYANFYADNTDVRGAQGENSSRQRGFRRNRIPQVE